MLLFSVEEHVVRYYRWAMREEKEIQENFLLAEFLPFLQQKFHCSEIVSRITAAPLPSCFQQDTSRTRSHFCHLDPQKRRRRAQRRQELLRARGAAAPPGQVPAAEAAPRLLPHQGAQEGPRPLRAQQLHGQEGPHAGTMTSSRFLSNVHDKS